MSDSVIKIKDSNCLEVVTGPLETRLTVRPAQRPGGCVFLELRSGERNYHQAGYATDLARFEVIALRDTLSRILGEKSS